MSEKAETKQETIAQKFKGVFNDAGAVFESMFSIPVGCEELEYAVIPSKMTIDVSLALKEKTKRTNVLEIKLARQDDLNKKAQFGVTCDLNSSHDKLKVSVYSLDPKVKPRDAYIQFSGDETAVSASREGKNAGGYEDIVQHLKDQISNYWFAGDRKIKANNPADEKFVGLVEDLWPSRLEKKWKTDRLNLSEIDVLNFVCALVFVDVFRRMISDVLCTKPENSDEVADKLVWDRIENLREIIGIASDYRQKISEIYLEPKDVDAELSKQGLQFSPAVIDQVCSALSSGGHLILTGLPGCGKTCLAEALAKAAKVRSVVATANPCWSTDDLIGRYLPSIAQEKGNGTVLEFKEGFFLNAIANEGWLIIDELNRAPIDSCFGELFTVLSGKQVDLPFRTSEDKTISIVPEDSRKTTEQNLEQSDDDSVDRYVLRKNFRIICTMNDVDSVSLNALSFALQRRFYIVHVDIPGSDVRRAAFEKSYETALKSYENFFLNSEEYDKLRSDTTNVSKIINQLFADKEESDFVSKGIVGMAQPKEIIQSSVSRMVEKNGAGWRIREFANDDERDQFLMSGIAMGVVMKVYPQLVNRPEGFGSLEWVRDLLRRVFSNYHLRLRSPAPSSSGDLSVVDYLRNEFLRCFAHSPEVKDLWPETTEGNA